MMQHYGINIKFELSNNNDVLVKHNKGFVLEKLNE